MNPVTGLSLGRIAIGLLSFFRPALAARLFGFHPEGNPQLATMTRLFGAREIALGAVTLTARGTARRNLTIVGMAVDSADAGASVLGVRERSLPKRAGILLAAVAVGAVVSAAGELAKGD